MSDFKPPEMTHVVIDEDMQMQKYLADIAMEDIMLSPPPSAREDRPGGLMAQYRKMVADQHAIEAAGGDVPAVEEVDIGATVGLGGGFVTRPAVIDFGEKG